MTVPVHEPPLTPMPGAPGEVPEVTPEQDPDQRPDLPPLRIIEPRPGPPAIIALGTR